MLYYNTLRCVVLRWIDLYYIVLYIIILYYIIVVLYYNSDTHHVV